MPEQHHGLGFLAPRKIDLQAVAEFVGAVKVRRSAQDFELLGQQRAQPVGGSFVVAGRLDLDQLAGGLHHLFLFCLEIAQTLAPRGLWP